MNGERVALVVGGAGEIGAACVEALRDDGCRTYAGDLVRARGAGVLPLDVTDAEQVAAAITDIEAAEGRLDVLVLSMGYSGPQVEAVETGAEQWADVLDVNVRGAVRVFQAAVPVLRRSPVGRIVVISSIVADSPRWGRSAYGAAKSALSGLTRIWALEEASHGLLVNAVCPGPVDTAFFRASLRSAAEAEARMAAVPIGRLVTPEDVAAAVRFLASPGAAGITGQSLHVNGGELMR